MFELLGHNFCYYKFFLFWCKSKDLFKRFYGFYQTFSWMAMHLKYKSLSYHGGALRCLHPCSSRCINLGYLSAFQKAINCHFWLTLKHCIPFLNRKISFMLVSQILSVLFQKMYSIFWMYGFLFGKGSKKKIIIFNSNYTSMLPFQTGFWCAVLYFSK